MTVRLAVVGMGWWARFAHLPGIASCPEAALASVSETSLPAPGTADGVVIATPHHTHYPLAVAALDAGFHVLVEKPMTTSSAEAWDLVDRAERAGLHLSVGYTAQYTDAAVAARAAVQEEIGELACVSGELASTMMGLIATNPTYADGQARGQLTHLAEALTHTTDQAAAQVFAMMTNHGLDVDVTDALTIRLTGGAVATLASTGTLPEGIPHRNVLRYYGTAGTVEHDLQYGTAVIHRADGTLRRVTQPTSDPAWPRYAPVQAFARLIAGTGPNHAPGAAAAAAVDLVEAAHASASSGTVQNLDLGRSWSTSST